MAELGMNSRENLFRRRWFAGMQQAVSVIFGLVQDCIFRGRGDRR
jgi:hypothetical protein